MSSKYMIFEPGFDKAKTKTWTLIAKSTFTELGRIEWYPAWRQYCFLPKQNRALVFSKGCLEEINAFIEAHKNDRVVSCTKKDAEEG